MRIDEVLGEAGLTGIAEPLGRYVTGQRWFGGRDRTLTGAQVVDAGVLSRDPLVVHLVVRVELDGGDGDLYTVQLGATPVPAELSGPEIARLSAGGREVAVHDAIHNGATALALWRALERGQDLPTCEGRLVVSAPGLAAHRRRPEEVRMVGGEQSNSALSWNDREFLKLIRRVEPGPSVEVEMARALDQGGFRHHAPVLATIGYQRAGAPDPSPVAIVQPFLAGARDGWTLAREALEPPVLGAGGSMPMLEELGRLGTVTAEMHRALSSPHLPPAMAAQPVTAEMLNRWAGEMIARLDQVAGSGTAAAAELARVRDRIHAEMNAIRGLASAGLATRVHGDYHLGQVVLREGRWTVLDFEGEPRRPPAQRRARYSPMRDVAGMLRSFDYVAASIDGGREGGHRAAWVTAASDALWSAYRRRVAGSGLIPEDPAEGLVLRRAFELDKAVYEVDYEGAHRPDWAAIPLRFLTSRYH